MNELPRYSMWLPQFGVSTEERPSLFSRLVVVLRRALLSRIAR
jgi:hypothetical protein